MAKSNTEKYRHRRGTVKESAEHGYITQRDCKALLEFCDTFDEGRADQPLPNPTEMYPGINRKVKHVQYGTLTGYLNFLSRVAYQIELTDPERDSTDINMALSDILQDGGKNPIDPEAHPRRYKRLERKGGVSRSYVNNLAKNLRKFYRWYAIDHETEVAVSGIRDFNTNKDNNESRGWGPRDMLEPSEEQALFNACQNSRDRAIFYTLRWSGMRSTAARNLKWRDIDFESGEYYFPTTSDGEGLKNIADKHAARPLLHAEKVLQAWKKDHPDSDDPEAHVFTANPDGHGSHHYDPYDTLGKDSLRNVMNKLKERAGIDKPCHPHMMRHNYVTTLKVVWELDNEYIKWLIGHTKDSDVMQTTYSHLGADDIKKKTLIAAGLRSPDSAKAEYRGDTCVNCGNHTDPSDMKCNTCGRIQDIELYLRTKEVDKQADKDIHQTAIDAETESEKEAAEAAKEVHDSMGGIDPETANALLEANKELMQRVYELEEKVSEDESDTDPSGFDPENYDVSEDIAGRKSD